MRSLVTFGIVLAALSTLPTTFRRVPDDLTFRILLSRYDELCLQAFPGSAAVAQRIYARGLMRVDPYQTNPGKWSGIVEAWTGDLATSGADAGKELVLQIADPPLQACGVTTRLASAPTNFQPFSELVTRYLLRTHRNGEVIDDTADAQKQSAPFGFTIPLRLNVAGEPSEIFYLAVWPARDGLVQIQFNHRLVVTGSRT